MLYIVGLGPGSKEYILPKATEVMENCDVVIGFKRAIDSLRFIKSYKKIVYSLKETVEYANENEDKNVAIVASGDPCFYGITDFINANYQGEVKIIPGISSFQYLMARINKSWQSSFVGSLHGREEDFIEKVKNSSVSIWLTDNKNSPQALCRKLSEENLKVKVYIGENLSYEDEKILQGEPEKFVNSSSSGLSVFVVERM